MLLAVAMLAGCSENEAETTPAGNADARVAIRLNSGIEATTKAPVKASATVQIEGWEDKSAANYSGASTWQSTAEVMSNSDAQSITLSPLRYYNADENTKTYIKGWYPQVASQDGTVTFSNDDGTTDVLYAAEVSGSKDQTVSQPLVFNHKSTQLVFKVKKGEGLAAGTKIKTIKVKNTAVPTSITLTGDQVNYTEKSELLVPNLSVAEIGDEAAMAGEPVMIRPEADNSTVKLLIETTLDDGSSVAATYNNVAFTTSDGKLSEGSAYTVELTFSQGGIQLSAHITPWTEATGSGTVM